MQTRIFILHKTRTRARAVDIKFQLPVCGWCDVVTDRAKQSKVDGAQSLVCEAPQLFRNVHSFVNNCFLQRANSRWTRSKRALLLINGTLCANGVLIVAVVAPKRCAAGLNKAHTLFLCVQALLLLTFCAGIRVEDCVNCMDLLAPHECDTGSSFVCIVGWSDFSLPSYRLSTDPW